jgi:hypothetical protein
MLRGLIFRGDYELRLTVSGSGTSAFPLTGVAGAGGSIATGFTPDYLTIATGILMIGSVSTGSVNEGTAQIVVPALGIDQSRTYPGTAPVEMHCVIKNIRLFIDFGGNWVFKADGLEWRVNGLLEHAVGSFTLPSGMPAIPSAIPLIGIFPEMTPTTVLDPLLALGSCLPEGYPGGPAGNAVTDLLGGWRITPFGGTTYTAPITIPSNPNVSGGDSYNVAIHADYEQVNDPGYTAETATGFSVWVIPDYTKAVVRMRDGFESLLFRWGADAFGIRSGSIEQVADCTGNVIIDDSSVVDTEIFQAKSQMLSTVFNAADVIEELFASTPCWLNGGTTTNFAAIGSVGFSNEGQQWLKFTLGQPSGALNHLEQKAVFVNTWLHPLWSYGLWFPPDSASTSVRWDLQGADSDIDYWYQVRQQHVTHPALTVGDNTARRTNVVVEPITQNALTGFWNSITGTPCPWGVNRFGVLDRASHPSSFTTSASSAPRFRFRNGLVAGAGSVGAGVVELTTGDAIEFDLASFTAAPFMAPTLADRLNVTWSATNASAVRVYAVGADGTRRLITNNVQGTFRIPYGTAKKWITSAVEDFGATYLVDDYVPIAPSNDSALAMSDINRVSNFGLLPGYAPTQIRFEIDKIDPLLPASINHITFQMAPWSDAKVFHENGRIATIVFKDGPMVRYGALSFYNYFLDTPISVPLLAGLSLAPTLGDLWAWENCFLKGIDAQTGIFTRLQAEFFQGEEFTVVDHAWRDPDKQIVTTSAFVESSAGPVGIYSNSYRSAIPPLGVFAEKERTSGQQWKANGFNANKSYSFSTSRHHVIVPGGTQPQFNNGSNALVADSAPTGWSVGYHSLAVNNNEGYDWTLRLGATNWFRCRPWRGFSFMPGASVRLLGLRMCRDEHLGFLHVVIPASSGVTLLSWNEKQGTERTRTVTADPSTSAGIAWSAESRLLVVIYDFNDAGTYKIKRTQTDSQGLAWSAPEMLWEGKGSDNVFDAQGREYISYWEGGKFKVKVRLAPGQAWSSAYDIAISAEEGTTAIEVSPDASAPLVVVTMVAMEPSPQIRRYESLSGGRLWVETT